jgi:hypothetical protein
VLLQAAIRAIESERKDRLFNDPWAHILAGPAVAYVKAQMKKQQQNLTSQPSAEQKAAASTPPPTPVSIRVLILQPMAEEGPGILQQYLLAQNGTTRTVGKHSVTCKVTVDVIPPAKLAVYDPATYSALVVLGTCLHATQSFDLCVWVIRTVCVVCAQAVR